MHKEKTLLPTDLFLVSQNLFCNIIWKVYEKNSLKTIHLPQTYRRSHGSLEPPQSNSQKY